MTVSVMSRVSQPKQRAVRECPSSCSTIEASRTTARPNEKTTEPDCRNMSARKIVDQSR